MGIKNVDAPNGDALYAINEICQFLDNFVIFPTATLSLVTGFFLSLFTNWGFVKHYWVMTKWVLTVSAIVFGSLWIGPWLNAMTSISATERLQALQNPLYMFDNQGIIWGGLAINITLLVIIAISLLKPWGRRLPRSAKKKRGIETLTSFLPAFSRTKSNTTNKHVESQRANRQRIPIPGKQLRCAYLNGDIRAGIYA